MWGKVNGIWRQIINTKVKVMGAWRDTDVHTKVKDWKQTATNQITEEKIAGVKLRYRIAPAFYQQYPKLPHLKYCDALPVKFFIGGDNDDFNRAQKGVSLYYYSHADLTEGISKWHGEIWLVLKDGREINLSNITPHEFVEGFTMELWGMAYSDPDDNNVPIQGWNSIFSEEQHLEKSEMTPDQFRTHLSNNLYNIEPKHILPVSSRISSYQSYLEIGIARNTSRAELNMLGSGGVIVQVIDTIVINGRTRPFMIVYDE